MLLHAQQFENEELSNCYHSSATKISPSVVNASHSEFSPNALSTETSFCVKFDVHSLAPRPAPLPLPRTLPCVEAYQLCTQDMEVMERFLHRTSLTLGSKASRDVYKQNIMPVAFSVRPLCQLTPQRTGTNAI